MNNMLKKTAMVLAISGATALTGVAHADYLYAHFAAHDKDAGVSTYLAFRTQSGLATGVNNLHYYWIKKGSDMADLHNLTGKCTIENTFGKATPNDMVYQSIRGDKSTAWATKRVPNKSYGSNGISDASSPSGYPDDFVGQIIIHAQGYENDGYDTAAGGNAYVVDKANGYMFDYELNRLSDAGAVIEDDYLVDDSKIVFHQWYPAGKVETSWLASVIPDSSALSELEGSKYFSASLAMKTAGWTGGALDTSYAGVAFDKDENPISGTKNVAVTCMGIYDRSDILTNAQQILTRTGGFVASTVAVNGNYNAGAFVHKIEIFGKGGPAYAPAAYTNEVVNMIE